MACFLGDGIGLAAILGDVCVDVVDDVWSDRGLHDIGKGNGGSRIRGHVVEAWKGLNGDKWACGCSGHLVARRGEKRRGCRV